LFNKISYDCDEYLFVNLYRQSQNRKVSCCTLIQLLKTILHTFLPNKLTNICKITAKIKKTREEITG